MKHFVFQRDRDPKHTAKIVENWFIENKIEKLDWVSQSPDLNPIEPIWSMMKKRMELHYLSNRDELWEILQQEWYTISP